MTNTAKKAAASKRGRKPMTDVEKAEAKRLAAFDYSTLEVEEATETVASVRAQESNEFIPHLQRSLAEADLTAKDNESGEIGKTFAFTAPDKGVAKRAKSKLTSGAEHLKCGVRVAMTTKDDGTVRVVWYARKTRKQYTARKGAKSASKS